VAEVKYTVKRGDSLWKICSSSTYGPKISGNTVNAKINTVVSLNNIKNKDLIYAGQTLILSTDGTTSSGSPTTTTSKTVQIKAFALDSVDQTGRKMYVDWNWPKIDTAKTKCYKVRWTQKLHGKWVHGADQDTTSHESMYCYATWSADEQATEVKVQIIPVAKTYKSGNDDKEYYTESTSIKNYSASKSYDFSNNDPLPPDKQPECELTGLKLTMTIDDLDAKKLDATHIVFQVIKDNKSAIYTSGKIQITKVTDDYYTVSHPYTVTTGSSYKVRAKSVNAKGKESGWSNFSNDVMTKPAAPKEITVCKRSKRSDGSIAAYLEWTPVTNATNYLIEYSDLRENLGELTNGEGITTVTTTDAQTAIEIIGIELGKTYFFQVRAKHKDVNDPSEPTAIVELPIGTIPAPPTTWSSANSAFVGETMELNWTHNPTDNSDQTYARISLKIGDGQWESKSFKNTTNANTGDRIDTDDSWIYGTAVSYKGTMYFKMDTTNGYLKNQKIQWKVQTAGVTGVFGTNDSDWSSERTIYIYEKPQFELTVTHDLAGDGELITTLETFPFYIRGRVILDSYEIQRPVGYHLRIVANEYYDTVDDAGRAITVNSGDQVYSKYFSTSDELIVEMSANNVNLESGITYTTYCTVDMSTGLSIDQQHPFEVVWSDVEYTINADVSIDLDAYTALINPHCLDLDGNLIDGVTLAVYRREYDGTFTEIASGIPNTNTHVTDPHPSLDYARYRLVAKDTDTGAVSFYDMPGQPVLGTSIIIQWSEDWTTFDVDSDSFTDAPAWSGSMLKLDYNVDVVDSRQTEVSLIEYAGRKHPVSYYGTQMGEKSSWSVTIPKDDKDTIYALRRLSIWSDDVYIREPSGLGYWANVSVSFTANHKDVTIPVKLEVTRVEGGV
jgi:hypothetical protein